MLCHNIFRSNTYIYVVKKVKSSEKQNISIEPELFLIHFIFFFFVSWHLKRAEYFISCINLGRIFSHSFAIQPFHNIFVLNFTVDSFPFDFFLYFQVIRNVAHRQNDLCFIRSTKSHFL